MTEKQISKGVVHIVPNDLYAALVADNAALEKWEDLTSLARNDWICWTINVKTEETRKKHVGRVISELNEGKRRPCCWVGCVHRLGKKAYVKVVK